MMLYKTKFTRGLAMLLAGAVLLAGCGRQAENGQGTSSGAEPKASQSGSRNTGDGEGGTSGAGGPAAMGRYTDSQVELPNPIVQAGGLVWNEEKLRAVDATGLDYLSEDKGETFQYDLPHNEGFQQLMQEEPEKPYLSSSAVTPEGDRLAVIARMEGETIRYEKNLYTADNQVIELTDIPESETLLVYYGNDGWFYGTDISGKIYRIDPKTGAMTFLFQADSFIGYIAVAGKWLMGAASDRMLIFDLEKNELADQDSVLDDLLKNELKEVSYSGYPPFLIVQGRDENSIYVVTKQGLYHHAIHGNVMEQIIDGSLCSIGDESKAFSGMAAMSGAEQDDFLILYHDGTLMRYTYDPEIPTVPDKTLRVFSMYDDQNVKLAVSAFQLKHREIYVKYEVGVSDDNGMTTEDVLKNLSTELAAGKGPDVLVMDNIPYESYVEKGVLADLSGLEAAMQQEDPLFEKIVNNFKEDNKLYAIPMTFSIPVLAGAEELVNGLNTLADLADLMESTRQQQPEGSLLGFGNAQDALNILSQASSGAWVKEDGSLDKDAVKDFLTQVKRIYDAQMSGISADDIEFLADSRYGRMDLKGMTFYNNYRAASAASTAFYLNQPFSAGNFAGTIDDLAMYASTLKVLNSQFVLMPGQQQGACIPSSLLAVNQAGEKEEAENFVKYAISGEFQGSSGLTNCPINRAGYEAGKISPYGTSFDSATEPFASISAVSDDGRSAEIDIFWPSADDLAKMDELVESFDAVSTCDDRVFAAVTELGAKAVTGDTSVEDAVNEIEKKVQLYLAE